VNQSEVVDPVAIPKALDVSRYLEGVQPKETGNSNVANRCDALVHEAARDGAVGCTAPTYWPGRSSLAATRKEGPLCPVAPLAYGYSHMLCQATCKLEGVGAGASAEALPTFGRRQTQGEGDTQWRR